MAGGLCFAGVDEVGRGCLAGPVVAAAVVIRDVDEAMASVNDSKQLSARQRQALSTLLMERCHVGIGEASVEEIDTLNILRASQIAMGRALERLHTPVELALVDGNAPAATPIPCLPIVDGDGRSLSIAAASIVAKVYRDRLMTALHDEYPEYGFARNVGYGTKEHRAALERYGPTPYHRTSFAPVRQSRQMQMRLLPNG